MHTSLRELFRQQGQGLLLGGNETAVGEYPPFRAERSAGEIRLTGSVVGQGGGSLQRDIETSGQPGIVAAGDGGRAMVIGEGEV